MSDAFVSALKQLKPTAGPPVEAVAFAAGSLAATRRLRRRFVPLIALLTVTTLSGWGGVIGLTRPPQPEPPRPGPPPVRYAPPTAWQARLKLLSADGFEAFGPDPVTQPDATPDLPPFPWEQLS